MQEIWREVKGFEGLYIVSNKGNIKSLKNNRLLSTTNNSRYCLVALYKGGVKTYKHVHRIVAETFCSKPNHCEIVNHLDNNTRNNNADNLEWTTPKGNTQHAVKQGRMKSKENVKKAITKTHELFDRPVIAQNDTRLLFYSSMRAAEKDGFSHSKISLCCNGKQKTHKGFSWRFAKLEREKEK